MQGRTRGELTGVVRAGYRRSQLETAAVSTGKRIYRLR